MVNKKNINKKLMKQVAKNGFYDLTGADLEEVSKVVEKESLRKGKKGKKSVKRDKKSCGCDI